MAIISKMNEKKKTRWIQIGIVSACDINEIQSIRQMAITYGHSVFFFFFLSLHFLECVCIHRSIEIAFIFFGLISFFTQSERFGRRSHI